MTYLQRLRNFWFPDRMALVWLLFALPALYFFQTAVHEGTHGLAAFIVTGSFPKVAPFPHETTGDGPLNGVTLADTATTVIVNTRTSCDSAVRSDIPVLAGFPAAPQFLDIVLVVAFTAVFCFAAVRDPLWRFPLRAWYLGAGIDFMYNTARGLVGSCNPIRDWSKFQLLADISPGLFALLTWALWLVVLSHFAWVYWSAWGRTPVARQTGFWDYRWIAFALGILSLIAVLLSITVSDPEINKASVAFVAPFIVQVAALVWYWVYFALTFRYRPT